MPSPTFVGFFLSVGGTHERDRDPPVRAGVRLLGVPSSRGGDRRDPAHSTPLHVFIQKRRKRRGANRFQSRPAGGVGGAATLLALFSGPTLSHMLVSVYVFFVDSVRSCHLVAKMLTACDRNGRP